MAKFSDNYRFRFYFLAFVFLSLGGLLAGRLFYIQVKGHEYYSYIAEKQINSDQSKSLVAIRGSIYFKEKNGSLISAAAIKEGFLAAINPQLIDDPEKACKKLGEVVSLDLQTCVERASKKYDPFEEIVHRLSYEEGKKIKDLDISGAGAYPEQWRFSPAGSLASHVLGFVGYSGDHLEGRYGLEGYYENILRGKEDDLKKGESFAALFLRLSQNLLEPDIYNGKNLILTVEPTVQGLLEKQLESLLEKYEAESAGGIIINPQTGEIIAMSAKPDYNPNEYNLVRDMGVFRNPLISDLFEMGSVFKPLTLAAAMDADKITPSTTYVDNGFLIIDNTRIENYDGKARGKVDMQAVLNNSLNTGAIFAMRQLGKDAFRQYFLKYGLEEKTGIDLADETKGNLKNLSSPREIECASASFGQGVAVTPIEFASAVSALANGGLIMKPHVVSKIVADGEKDISIVPEIKNRAIGEKTSEEITRMLVRVVDEALLGGTVKLKNYSVAAKTGTAQIPNKEGKYYEDRYLHTFFGYAPAFDAKFLVFLYLKNPQGVRYASYSLTPPFMETMKFLLNYYQIPPDR